MNGQHEAPGPALGDVEKQARPWKLITLFAFAICAFGILILIARVDPNPSQTNWYIYLTVLALAAAGVAGLLPGAINFEVAGWLKASGALGVLALIFYFGVSKATPAPSNVVMKSFLTFGSSSPSSPFDSDVYVFVNRKVAKADVVSHNPLFPVEDSERGSTIQVVRSREAGFRIDFARLVAGDQLYVVVHSPTGQWRSNDIVIPEGQLSMTPVPPTDAH